jgi:signal transduction histidine kinase
MLAGPPVRIVSRMTKPVAKGRRRADVLVFLLAVCFTGLVLVDGVDGDLAPAWVAVDVGLGGIACLGAWVRRRRPVEFAVVAGVLSIFSVAAAGVSMIALFNVAVHRRFAVVAPIVAGYSLAATASRVVRPDMTAMDGSQALLAAACVAGILAWGMFVRARRQSLREREWRAAAERELLVAQARQLERNRIAREMHDVLAHRISLVSLHAGALELRLAAAGDGTVESERSAAAAGVIRDCAHQALEDLREVIGVLREDPAGDAPDRPQPTLVDLPGLVEESRRAGMAVRLDSRVGDAGAVPPVVGRSAYRIVQEGLTNARKHAHGSAVSVIVRGAAGDGLSVEVRNPWPGVASLAAIPGAGAGIIGLAERAALAGGRLEHGRSESGEFRLRAWLPWPT